MSAWGPHMGVTPYMPYMYINPVLSAAYQVRFTVLRIFALSYYT